MKTKRLKDPTPFTAKNHKRFVRRAIWYVHILRGDAGYTNPRVNAVALESMLIGWMSAQAWFCKYAKWLAKHYPRTDICLLAGDAALQACVDATSYYPGRFKWQ